MTLTIDVRYDASDTAIWGSEDPADHNINAEASENALIELTEQAIREAYPEADITFKSERVANGNRIRVEAGDYREEDNIRLDIDVIIGRIYESQTWIV